MVVDKRIIMNTQAAFERLFLFEATWHTPKSMANWTAKNPAMSSSMANWINQSQNWIRLNPLCQRVWTLGCPCLHQSVALPTKRRLNRHNPQTQPEYSATM